MKEFERRGGNPPRPARREYDIPPARRAGEGEFASQPGRPGKPEFRTQPGGPGRPEFHAQPGRPGKPEFHTQPGRPGKPEFHTQPGRPGKPEFRTQPGGPGRPEFRTQPGGPGRPDFSGLGDGPLPLPGEPPFPQREFGARRPRPAMPPAPPEPPENLLAGRNPIREAIRSEAPVEKLLVASGDLSGAARDIVRMAREAGIVVQFVERNRLDQIYPAHQGMLAFRAAREYSSIEDILERARERGEAPLVVVLDGITDPHNLGAIIRSCECAGAHGVVLPERRSAGLTPACEKAAAGALNHVLVARVKNINRALQQLKEAGLWVVAAAFEGEDALECDLSGPLALVIGSEGEGISRLTLEGCDRKVTLPLLGEIGSLNASVAAGVLLYQVVRSRRLGK